MIYKAILFILLSTWSWYPLQAGNHKEYIHNILSKSKQTISQNSFFNNPIVRTEIDSLLHLSASKQDKKATCQLAFDICTQLYRQAAYHELISYITYSQPMLKELSAGNKDTESTYINLLDLYGMAYKEIGLINQGMNILFRALALAEHKQLQIETAILYNNIAATYMQQGRFSKADSLFTKATLINENLKDKSKLFVNYNNLSVAATKQKDYNKALEYAFLAMHQLDTRSDSDLVILMQRNIGGIYLHQNQPSLALQQLTAVKHYQERHQQTNYLPNTYNMLAEIYQHNDDSLKHYLLKALNTAILEKSEEDYSGILYKLANLYERKKDYRTANRYFKQYTTIKDSLLSSNEESQVNSLLHMYLEEQKQHQKIESIQLQQYQTLKQMRIVLSAATILVLLTVLYSLLRLRKEKILQQN